MMDKSVPILISAWSGTGIVTVVSPSRFCMTMWLPRWRTLAVDDHPKGRRSDRRAHDRLTGWTHDGPATQVG
jgi:hypothetical protein